MTLYDQYGNTLEIYPIDSPSDTLMACFSLYLNGSESRKNRQKLRQKLLKHFKNIMFDGEGFDNIKTENLTHNVIRSFVNRLHKADPNRIPRRSPELMEPKLLSSEAIKFLQKNQKEGFISDKITFCYLLCDLMRIDVYLFQPEEIYMPYEVAKKSHYAIYILHNENGFSLLLPHQKYDRAGYVTPLGIVKRPTNLSLTTYELLPGFLPLTPPSIPGYQVHSIEIDGISTKTPYSVGFIRKPANLVKPLYVLFNGKVISCTMLGLFDPTFYLEGYDGILSCVAADSAEEAEKIVRYETKIL